jgi:hypothetical protein
MLRNVPKEDSRERPLWPPLHYVLGQRAADLLEQRHETLAAALCPADAKLAPSPIDVAQFKAAHLLAPKARRCQDEQQRSVALACGLRWIAA